MKYKNIIFDVDGILIDTETAVLKTWQLTLKQYGYDYSLTDLNVILGIPTTKGLEKLKVTVDDNYEKQWISNYEQFKHMMNYFDGIQSMLNSLKERGIVLGIVTSRRQKELDDFFSEFQFNKIFDIIICADDTIVHKPNPEPIYEYIHRAGSDKNSCIYIGDMQTDIDCANKAGIKSGIVAWANDAKIIQGATYTFTSPIDVVNLIEEN